MTLEKFNGKMFWDLGDFNGLRNLGKKSPLFPLFKRGERLQSFFAKGDFLGYPKQSLSI